MKATRLFLGVVAAGLCFSCSQGSLDGTATAASDPHLTASAASRTAMTFEADNATTWWGQNVYVVGSTPELGNWDPTKATVLSAANYPNWTGTVSMAAGEAVQFKFIIIDPSGNVTWEAGNNRAFPVPTATAATYAGPWNNTSQGNVVVTNSSSPVSITSPANGANVSGTVAIQANATAGAGVSSVAFFVDTTQIGTSASAPYSVSWDSTTVPNGVHTLSAQETDGAGNVTNSPAVNVNVSNGNSGADGGSAGSVGPTGGSVDHLFFAVVGDTRPATQDDTASYPTAVIQKIYADIQGMNPRPQFVVGTGDYMFATPSGSEGANQIALYQQARQQYTGTVFAAMGNHECNGYTAGNCAGSPTNNMTAYINTLVQPLGYSLPYYAISINSTSGAWTAKLIVVACNDWDQTQLNWLQQQLAQPTTYTFVARHEPAHATNGPCVNDVENLLASHPYSLSITGHTHTFSTSGKEIIVGTGGAPLASTGVPYGYATVEQTATGFRVTQYDYSTGLPVSTVNF